MADDAAAAPAAAADRKKSLKPPGKKDGAQSESVGVFARFKPLKGDAERADVTVAKRFNQQKSVQVRNLEFSLDWIFDTDGQQEDVYEIAGRDRVTSVLEGYNSTLLCYGQTGSGKTHTMFGPDEVLYDFANCDRAQWGLVPRATEQLFAGIEQGSVDSNYIVQCSYIEVYNDRLNDLLGGKQNCPLREMPNKGITVDGLSYELVTTSAEVMRALYRGTDKRVIAAMAMNPRSSRGHAIFTIYVKEIQGIGGEKSAKLNLVDLAGMESSKKSYATEGASNNAARKEEAKNINQSLYALGSVIEKLSASGTGKAHVPWRDSKLTRLLQDSLGGNCKSTIIVTLRTEAQNVEEAIVTLRFAQRAKAVKTKVKDNTVTIQDTAKLLKELEALQEQVHTQSMMVQQLQGELAQRNAEEEQRLQQRIEEAGAHKPADGAAAVDSEVVAALQEEVAHLQRKNRALRCRTVMHRMLQVQSHDALHVLKEDHSEVTRQLRDAQEVLSLRSRENNELHAKVDELEEVLERLVTKGATLEGAVAGRNSTPSPDARRSSARMSRGSFARESSFDEHTISSAEDELKAAMESGDPERIKKALAAASGTVAKAKARHGGGRENRGAVVGKQHMLRGGGKKPGLTPRGPAATPRGAPNAVVTDENEARYLRFHEMATARKLALATRGFELQNCFIEQLYDKAVTEKVGEGEWHAFIRQELPSPRLDGADDDDEGAASAADDGKATPPDGAAPRNAARRRSLVDSVKAVVNWGREAKASSAAKAKLHRFQLFEELPTGVQATASELAGDVYDESTEAMAAKARARSNSTLMLGAAAPAADAPAADDGADDGGGGGGGERKLSRAQRYNQAVRERQAEREQRRTPRTPRQG